MYVIPSRAILLLEGQLLLRTGGSTARKFKSLTLAIEELLLKRRQNLHLRTIGDMERDFERLTFGIEGLLLKWFQDLILTLAQLGMIKAHLMVLGRIFVTLVNLIHLEILRT
jgi:hypothetical protein